MTQLDLAEWQTGNAEQLERVELRISDAVLDFLRAGVRPSRKFHMRDLTSWVERRVGIAPDSAGRVLRDLRKRQLCSYRVIDRAKSTYSLLWVSQ